MIGTPRLRGRLLTALAAVATLGASGLPAGCSSSDGDDARAAPPTSTVAPADPSASPSTTTPTTVAPPSTRPTTSPGASTDPSPAAAPVTAAALAAELTEVERLLRDPDLDVRSDAELLAALGRRQQLAYRQLARHDELDAEVLALVPDDVAGAVAFNIAARQAVTNHAAGRPPTEPPATLPAWTIRAPAPIDELLAAYTEAEGITGVPWEYLAAINFVETRMGRIVGESSAGAIGPMQFLPETWAACCEGDPNDPHDAIVGAAVYLAANGAPGDMAAALYAYNPNEGYVGQVTAYAANLTADPAAYRGYHGWEVLVGTSAGTVRLPTGFSAEVPIDAATYVAAHPEDLLAS